MAEKWHNSGIVLTGLLTLCLVGWWFNQELELEIRPSVSGMDGATEARLLAKKSAKVEIGEIFKAFPNKSEDMDGEWLHFRGNDYDNICKDKVALADHWGVSGPKKLWEIQLGEGHAAPVVKNGRLFILDYDEENQADLLRCFSLKTGKELWQRGYKVRIKRNHGISRTVCAVDNKYVVSIGPMCHVMCVKVDTGDLVWGIDMVAEYGTKIPGWYTGQCPIIDNGVAILAPCGNDVLMMGVECETGKVLWKTPRPAGWKMSHASIMPMVLGNQKMWLYNAIGGLAAVNADGENRGEISWQTKEWDHSVIAPSPLMLPDGKIFVTAGYGAGSMLLKVTKNENEFQVDVIKTMSPKEGLASEQQTPLFYQEMVWGIHPKDAGARRQQLACYHPDDLSTPVWTSGKERRFGLGPYLIADEKLLVLNDDGELFLLEANTNKYIELARSKVLGGHDAWGPMVLINGLLLLRDSKQMICLDLTD